MLPILFELSAPSFRFHVDTEHPVAVDSIDHLQPFGTVRDNNGNPILAERLKWFAVTEALSESLIDLGCAGGRWVRDAHEAGLTSVGVEGSDTNRRGGHHEWPHIPDLLHTADIRYPFQIQVTPPEIDGAYSITLPFRATYLTAWEVMEHIEESAVPQVLTNIVNHLESPGWFIGTIACNSSWNDGHEYHATIQPIEWWDEQFARHGLIRDETMEALCQGLWVRDHGTPRVYRKGEFSSR